MIFFKFLEQTGLDQTVEKIQECLDLSSSPRKQACFKCDQEGHFARECPISKSSSLPFQSKNRSPSPQTNPLNLNRLEM